MNDDTKQLSTWPKTAAIATVLTLLLAFVIWLLTLGQDSQSVKDLETRMRNTEADVREIKTDVKWIRSALSENAEKEED